MTFQIWVTQAGKLFFLIYFFLEEKGFDLTFFIRLKHWKLCMGLYGSYKIYIVHFEGAFEILCICLQHIQHLPVTSNNRWQNWPMKTDKNPLNENQNFFKSLYVWSFKYNF